MGKTGREKKVSGIWGKEKCGVRAEKCGVREYQAQRRERSVLGQIACFRRSGHGCHFPDAAIKCLSHLLKVPVVFLGKVLAFRFQGNPV